MVPSALVDRCGWLRGEELVVLGWHNVESTWRYPAPAGSGLRGFVRQMRALRSLTNVVPLESAFADLHAGRRLPHRAVALTFDDGYLDNLELAVPVLRDLGLPAVFYLVPGILDGDVTPWWERVGWAFAQATVERAEFAGVALDLTTERGRVESLDRVESALKGRDEAGRQEGVAELVEALAPKGSGPGRDLFMDWDDAKRLVGSGAAIGSHTMRHSILARESGPSQLADLEESKRRLEAGVQTPISSLAYPNGQADDYDATTRAAARTAGFSSAVTTCGLVTGRGTDPFDVRRRILAPQDNVAMVVAGLVRGSLRNRSAA
jgi:peptidoglycan/xylan/chitin deacetylase (PgdA/CDA1 family)